MTPDPGSFRDRSNRVFDNGKTIARGVSEAVFANWRAVGNTSFFKQLTEEGKVVRTSELDAIPAAIGDEWPCALAHERIPFISYPYEWSFDMLKDAALLHLEIIERAMEEGWTLKDATAYNVQWIGSRPVFIDIPSFEPYVEGDPWIGYRQFCMMFLYPLMLRAYKDVDYLPFLRGSLEGIDPATASRILRGATLFRRGVLGHVYLHAKMQTRYASQDLDEAAQLTEDAKKDGPQIRKRGKQSFAMVMGTIQGIRRTVERLDVVDRRTVWGNYDTEHSYGTGSFDAKQEFVRKHVLAKHRSQAWDLGCNTGTFSRICAENTDYVLAVDGDEKAVDRMYRKLKTENRDNILPLVMNLNNISPDQGWRGRERPAFDRRGKPDLVLCLALIHHIVISANIPLREFLGWLHELGTEVIIEQVGHKDDMTRMLLRNRVDQYSELSDENFDAVVRQMFDVKDELPLKGGVRKLYHLAPK